MAVAPSLPPRARASGTARVHNGTRVHDGINADWPTWLTAPHVQDRLDLWSRLQRRRPVRIERNRRAVVVTGDPELRELLRHPAVGKDGIAASADVDDVASLSAVFLESPLALDAPRHPAVRRVARPVIAEVTADPAHTRMVAATFAAAIADAAREPIDLIERATTPIALAVSAAIAGTDHEIAEPLAKWGTDIVHRLSSEVTPIDTERAIAAAQSAVPEVERLLACPHARAGVLGALKNDPGTVTPGEAVALVMMAFLAGTETLSSFLGAIAGFVLTLAPAQRAHVLSDDAACAGLVDEVARLFSPVQYFYYRSLAPLEIGGVAIAADNVVVLGFGVAGRDPRVQEDPQRVRTNRADHGMAFSIGRHYCMGAQLSRSLGAATARAVARHAPTELTVADVGWGPRSFLHRLERLTVHHRPRSRP